MRTNTHIHTIQERHLKALFRTYIDSLIKCQPLNKSELSKFYYENVILPIDILLALPWSKSITDIDALHKNEMIDPSEYCIACALYVMQ